MYKLKALDTEITNRCNAACPLCPRTGTFSGVAQFMHNTGSMDVRPEIFDEILTSKAGSSIRKVTYCGNYGDPMVHPKALEIFQKCANHGVTTQKVDTNGAMRNADWWAKVGSIPGFEVNFAIDGLEDTNHLYRVNTNFKKILENAQAFIDAGGTAHWVFIVFEHNQHQVEEARALSKKMGFKRFANKETVRAFSPESGTTTLEGRKYKKSKKSDIIKTDFALPDKEKYKPEMVRIGYKERPVSCLAQEKSQLFLTCDENIIPCCHTQEFFHIKRYDTTRTDKKYKQYEIDAFYKKHDMLTDLNTYTFDEIYESYAEAFPYLNREWEDRALPRCNKKCGSNHRNVSRYTEN